MRKKIGTVLCICLLAGMLSGCGAGESNLVEDNNLIEESDAIIDAEQIIEESSANISETEYPEAIVPTAEEDNLALKYHEMPDLQVNYIPELGYHRTAQIRVSLPAIFVCWKDTLIIGDTIYKREDEIYQRTEERLQDWFNIEDDLNFYDFYQWENLLIVEDGDEIMVLDMDSRQTWNYPLDGYVQNVYQGKIYYRGHDKDVLCMDLLSGEVEVIYACDGGGGFMMRDNGDMIISVIKETRPKIWKFWLLSYDAQGDLVAEEIWETDTYEFMEWREFNDHGLFFIGDYYDWREDLLCLKDNGEREEMVLEEEWGSVVGQMIVDEGYFLWDSQMLSEEEKVEILASWDYDRPREAEIVVDSISYYDFQGNKLQTWQLIDDEMLEAGYRLKYMVYDKGDILAFYENEEFDDLYISRVQTL